MKLLLCKSIYNMASETDGNEWGKGIILPQKMFIYIGHSEITSGAFSVEYMYDHLEETKLSV